MPGAGGGLITPSAIRRPPLAPAAARCRWSATSRTVRRGRYVQEHDRRRRRGLLLLTAAAPAGAAPVTVGSPLERDVHPDDRLRPARPAANVVLPEPGSRVASPIAASSAAGASRAPGRSACASCTPTATAPTPRARPARCRRRRREHRTSTTSLPIEAGDLVGDRPHRPQRPDRPRRGLGRVLQLLAAVAGRRRDALAVGHVARRAGVQRRRRARAGGHRGHPRRRVDRRRHARGIVGSDLAGAYVGHVRRCAAH